MTLISLTDTNHMTTSDEFEVIIIGGSYAGLSAALALGRSLRKVLVIDSGNPCNRQTPHSHNFITQDGQKPKDIFESAKAQVLKYDTVAFLHDFVIDAQKTDKGFVVSTESGKSFSAQKLLFATGVTDQMPDLEGFAECWGISVLHCPYCHGYEVKHENIGILSNGETAFELCRLILNWTERLTLFTNGKSTLTIPQTEKIKSHHIKIVEKEIARLEHSEGKIQNIVFADESTVGIPAVFSRVGFKQHSDIPHKMGCELTEQGYIKVDDFHRTSIQGIYAAGDNTTPFRAVSAATAAGTKTGAFINKELIDEAF